MDKIKVSIINKPEICDERLISNLTKLTFSNKLVTIDDIKNQLANLDKTTANIAENTFKFSHTSISEHITLSFLLQNVSRATQQAWTRHRVGSWTWSSTHYINYSEAMDNPFDYFVMPIEIIKSSKDIQDKYIESCRKSIKDYCDLIEKGVECEVARDVLPLSFRSTGIWTVNLRSLQNFLKLRLCGVNTQEINYCAMLVYEEVKKLFPTIYRYFEPDCTSPACGKCSQGKRIERCIFKGWSLEKMHEMYKPVLDLVQA